MGHALWCRERSTLGCWQRTAREISELAQLDPAAIAPQQRERSSDDVYVGDVLILGGDYGEGATRLVSPASKLNSWVLVEARFAQAAANLRDHRALFPTRGARRLSRGPIEH